VFAAAACVENDETLPYQRHAVKDYFPIFVAFRLGTRALTFAVSIGSSLKTLIRAKCLKLECAALGAQGCSSSWITGVDNLFCAAKFVEPGAIL
jgi:hypothetical protein